MTEDLVRILRILEYTGPRKGIETLVSKSIQGTKTFDGGIYAGCSIRAATLGTYPEVLGSAAPTKEEPK